MKIWSPKTRILLPAIGGLALVGLTGAAVAKPDAGAEGVRAQQRGGGLCAQLECTDQQKEELRAVMTELRGDAKADREAIARLRGTIATEYAKARPDETAMRAAMKAIDARQREIQERGFDAMMEVHALLTPEQRAKVAKGMERRGFPGMLRGGKGKRGSKGKRSKGKRGERKAAEG